VALKSQYNKRLAISFQLSAFSYQLSAFPGCGADAGLGLGLCIVHELGLRENLPSNANFGKGSGI
jgi:hypothetical protein